MDYLAKQGALCHQVISYGTAITGMGAVIVAVNGGLIGGKGWDIEFDYKGFVW